MRNRNLFCILAVAVVIALALPAMAGPVKVTVNLPGTVKLAGHELKAGTYDVEAGDAKVLFKQKGKIVAEAPVKWEKLDAKAKNTAVISANDEIREIHFKGKVDHIHVVE